MASPVGETLERLEHTVGGGGSRSRSASTRTAEAVEQSDESLHREIYGLVLVVLATIVGLALVSYDPADLAPDSGTATANWIGPVGAALGYVLLGAVGLVAFPAVVTLGLVGVRFLRGLPVHVSGTALVAYLSGALAFTIILHVFGLGTTLLGHSPGGVVGLYAGEVSVALLSRIGTVIVFLSVLVVSFLVLTQRSLRALAGFVILVGRFLGRVLAATLRSFRDGDGTSAARVAPAATPAGTVVRRSYLARLAHRVKLWRAAQASRALERDDDGGDEPDDLLAPAPTPALAPAAAVLAPRTAEAPAEAATKKPRRKASPLLDGPADEPAWAAPRIVVEPAAAGADRPATPAPAPAAVAPVAPEGDVDDEPPPPAPVAKPVAPSAAPKPVATAPQPDAEPSRRGPRIVESDAMRKPPQPSLFEPAPPAAPPPPEAEYRLPDVSVLDYHPPQNRDIDREFLHENARRLEAKLADFNVKGEVVEIHPGPVVTTYEFQPAPGVKISRIQNLADDLTMALAAQRVRIIAPIPGKAVVGIEVPNKSREIVYLREVFEDRSFRDAKGHLMIALGKDIVGHVTVANLAKAPHLLVAGATGSGKSVAINAFLLSLLFRATPDEVKLIMVDPKMLELTVYQGIPHLLLPVVTDPKEASIALKWAVAEMERRYRLMSKFEVRNVQSFNQKVEQEKAEWDVRRKDRLARQRELFAADVAQAREEGLPFPSADETDAEVRGGDEQDEPPKKFPYLVVIIDELADLMMVASKDVETSIARLAQMARAAGIHLIVATQRPSVDVITGLIKANFPTRMSFQVASKIDSRTILDQRGAESLLGMGDMLYLPPGTSRLERNHGAFVSDDEVKRVVDFVKAQRKPDYDMDILKPTDEGGGEAAEEEPYDELYDQALAIVAESRQASISYLQRRLKIGYNRAARIVERMEREGVVGPSDGSAKPREILIEPV